MRVCDKEAIDAAVQRLRKPVLGALITQHTLFFRIANKGGFDQNGWHIRGFEDRKPRKLNLWFVQTVDVFEFVEHSTCEISGVFNLSRGR